jgi:hypothetical protein
MGWAGLTLVTDSDLGALEPQATNGKWQSVSWPNQRAEAKRDLRIWLETDFSEISNVADKIIDTQGADLVSGYTGGTYTDLASEATTTDEDDVDLSAVFATFGTDKLYLGSLGEFDGLQVRMLSTLNAIASVLTVKYSGPGGWTSLTATDGTANSGKTFGKSGRITWTVPSDWQRRTLNDSGDAYFLVELSISAALTAGTSAGQLLLVKAPDGLKRICALQALGYIVSNLAVQAPSTDYWMYKARNQFKTGFFDQAEKLYAAMRDKGGIPIDLDDDGQLDAGETNVTNPIRLGRA